MDRVHGYVADIIEKQPFRMTVPQWAQVAVLIERAWLDGYATSEQDSAEGHPGHPPDKKL